MRILALCGSLQAHSSNLTLLRTTAASAPPGGEVVLFDGLGALPLFNPDLEASGVPAPVEDWRRALSQSDGVLIASPEYGHSLPGSLKNAIDWVIGSGELERKVVAITAAVPAPERGRLGLKALRDTLGAVSAIIVGGEPIARGPNFAHEIAELLRDLVERVRSEQAQRENPGS
jgi:NAD(P)H-dependent FMN reductase